jgi:transketolase
LHLHVDHQIDLNIFYHLGHLGLPLGCADIGAVLFGSLLKYNPNEPQWINRDR